MITSNILRIVVAVDDDVCVGFSVGRFGWLRVEGKGSEKDGRKRKSKKGKMEIILPPQ